MDQAMIELVKKVIEEKVEQGFARFDFFCTKVCRQGCQNGFCKIDNETIAKAFDFVEGENHDGRNIIKTKTDDGMCINETRPLLSLFDPAGPLSVRQKIFAFFQVEDGKLGNMAFKEMAKRNEKFNIFLMKVCLYARDESMYEYADDEEMFHEIFG